MENEEIVLDSQETVLEDIQSGTVLEESVLDSPETVEEAAPVDNTQVSLDILSSMIEDYLEEKALTEEMEHIAEKEVDTSPVAQEFIPDPKGEVLELFTDLFSFNAEGHLLVESDKPLLFTQPIQEYTVTEGLLLCIFVELFALIIFKAFANLSFYRKGL